MHAVILSCILFWQPRPLCDRIGGVTIPSKSAKVHGNFIEFEHNFLLRAYELETRRGSSISSKRLTFIQLLLEFS